MESNYLLEVLPWELWENIFTETYTKTQIYFISTCKFFYNKLKITDLSDAKFAMKLNDEILSQSKFDELISLNASGNPHIRNVSRMKKLKILNASFSTCGIDQDGILGLDL